MLPVIIYFGHYSTLEARLGLARDRLINSVRPLNAQTVTRVWDLAGCSALMLDCTIVDDFTLELLEERLTMTDPPPMLVTFNTDHAGAPRFVIDSEEERVWVRGYRSPVQIERKSRLFVAHFEVGTAVHGTVGIAHQAAPAQRFF